MAQSAGIAKERWEGLLDAIELGKVVPIVGRRLSLVQQPDGAPPLTLEQVAAERFARDLGIDPLPAGWGLAELHRAMAEKDEFDLDTFHPKLKRLVAKLTPQLEPLRKLAEITHFRLFLCTAFDGYLEQSVRTVRGASETACSYNFAPGYENPMRPIARPGEVCVYHLLGSLETCPNWAVTSEELVEFVLGLSSEKYRPEQLFTALKDKHLLAIGCQIPDWLGRFFLRALRNGPVSQQKGLNLLVDDTLEADAAFERYLQTFGRKALVVSGDPVGFIDELHRRWKERVGDAPPPPTKGNDRQLTDMPAERRAKVFLSYDHADGALAQQLFEYLHRQGIDVWKDDRYGALTPSTNWDHEIRRQIADCACFVPLISRAASDKVDSYFWREWNQALDRWEGMNKLKARFIFPVLTERGVKVPDQFKAHQWTPLEDEDKRTELAQSLRDEQRRWRKEAR
jgi:hypothetical protein